MSQVSLSVREAYFMLKPGTRVRVGELKSTAGMLIAERHLACRKPGVVGVSRGPAAGHGGDVHFVKHDEDPEAVGAYVVSELEFVDPTDAESHSSPASRVVLAAAVCLHRGGLVAIAWNDRKKGWEFGGGRHQRAESIKETACREAREEMGVEIVPTMLAFVGYVEGTNEKDERYLTMIYACELPADVEPTPQPDEGMTEVRWVTLADINPALRPPCKPTTHVVRVLEEFGADLREIVER